MTERHVGNNTISYLDMAYKKTRDERSTGCLLTP
jgi:hypothetical protein